MPSVYDYRHIELDGVGSGKKRATRAEDTQSRLFGAGASPPESPRRLSASSVGSGVSVSPGFLIKIKQQRSNIFAEDAASPIQPVVVGSNNLAANPIPNTPGRMIKAMHQKSNIFPADLVNGSSSTGGSSSRASHFVRPDSPASGSSKDGSEAPSFTDSI